jgi:hypothetical protein
MIEVGFRQVCYVMGDGSFEESYHCTVLYAGELLHYINSSREACLLDFIEEMCDENIKIIEKE